MQTVIASSFALALSVGAWAMATSLDRRPLQKPKPTIPTSAEPTSLGEGTSVRYDTKRHIYIFSHPGYDGKPGQLYFELPTKADVVVEASVERSESSNTLLYKYAVRNLRTSKQGVHVLVVTPPVGVANAAAPD